ncbi:preprotein translocase subunit SecY [Candidatus Saccharibacteria bacterium]|nr:preprotein translocase subunit SecY [Candidatus Saccharibacteria bacterium]
MNWRNMLASLKNKDMLKRLSIVFGILIVYRFLAQIPVPLAEPTELRQVLESALNASDLGGFMNLLTGGALGSLSIVLVGLSPYITASVITQLLTKAIPQLEELHKDGESSRRKINQWTRMITLPLAVLQSVAFIFIIRQTVLAGNTATLTDTTPFQWVVAVTAMTVGSIVMMWLGELITEQGVGNGISLLIFAGIVAQLPTTFSTIWSSLAYIPDEASKLNIFNWFILPINGMAFWLILGISTIGLITLYMLVKINEAQRIITINYAKRVHGNTAYSGVKSILPVKLITAGVIPVIFAVAFLALPAFIGQLLRSMVDNPGAVTWGENLVKWFETPNAQSFAGATDLTVLIYPIVYFTLVVLFTYFYTSIVFNSNEIAESLQKQGGFIEGIRPGPQTEKYLAQTVNRLTFFGALALGIISIMPFIFEYVSAQMNVSVTNLAIGGTGLLIVVSVALETIRQINSRALMVTYDEY